MHTAYQVVTPLSNKIRRFLIKTVALSHEQALPSCSKASKEVSVRGARILAKHANDMTNVMRIS
jgi:hypothetical protein